MDSPDDSDGKEFSCNAEDLGLILGLGRSPGEGKGYPLWYSGLENSMDCIIHGVAKSRTQLSNFRFHLHFIQSYVMGFPHSSVGKESACKAGDAGSIPGLGRSPGEANGNLIPVFLPGKSHGQQSLVGYRPWGGKESDTTERLHFHFQRVRHG